jgi:hypothetical protein
MEWGKLRKATPPGGLTSRTKQREINMIRGSIAAVVGLAALAFVVGGNAEGSKDKELTVNDIMVKAHGKGGKGGGLRKKVIDGDASKEEAKQLIDLYNALAGSKCPKGDAADWKERTAAVAKLAKSGEAADLKKIDCKGCHDGHK